MNEIIKNRINDSVYGIVFNEELSLVEQTAKVHQYFKNFEILNVKRKDIIHFTTPEPEIIKELIIECHKIDDGLVNPDFFNKWILQAVQIIKKEIINNIFNELMI